MLLLMGIVCLVHLSGASDQLRAFIMDIEDTAKQLKECTEQLTTLHEEHEAEMQQLKQQLNETNVQLAAEIGKQKGMKNIYHFTVCFYHTEVVNSCVEIVLF